MNGMNIKIQYPRLRAIMSRVGGSDLSIFEFLIRRVFLRWLHLFPLFLQVVTEFLHSHDELLLYALVLFLLPDERRAPCLTRLVNLRRELALELVDLVVAECEHLLQLLLLLHHAADHAARCVVLVQSLGELSPRLL
jgi:hypothetical protein